MTQNDVELEKFITRIQDWYEADYQGFRTMYDVAIENVKPLPPDTPDEVYFDWNGWKDREDKSKINFLCEFFREWYKWKPGVNNGLDYIEKFSWLNYENDYGMVFATSGPGYRMTADFTALQGRYMDSKDSLELVEEWKKRSTWTTMSLRRVISKTSMSSSSGR